ncbi:3-oxoadipyl-CoA thiolase [Psychrobacter sp. F1192]|uniref:3-oxoadipyl-CoA thiolase n=1 Tax=Psychrobacter coccoides TaxID=2818440 RepID=A0ABS3NQB7_9GAMM|nr:3-oxoadipyl-CoA thiolase [Psychrobacter coccoides]MBO1531607.1 3-oxoadipyl-CoA thiolase [Psychrobacter coccoides]
MTTVYICHPKRSAVARYGGALADIRPDDLLAQVIKSVLAEAPKFDHSAIEDVFMGCANQSGEDNRNVARMSSLLSGLTEQVPATTINRLCGSGLDAVGTAFRAIASGEMELALAGGVESMTRAPFVMGKPEKSYDRSQKLQDTTMGWRFINKKLDEMYGTEAMPRTAENLAEKYNISREDQDAFAVWSQQKAAQAQNDGRLNAEITPITIERRKQEPLVVDKDEHPRPNTDMAALTKLRPIYENGTITAGNASGINDGAAAMLVASAAAVKKYGLTPVAKIEGMATAGVLPTIMGIGPVPATQKLLKRLNLSLDDVDIIELNEAFAAQALACSRELGLDDHDERINPRGGAIALGHPLGASGARILISAIYELQHSKKDRALCTMCIGVGQGIALVVSRVGEE